MKRIRVLAEPTRGLQEYHDSVDNPSWDEFCSHHAGASLRELRDTLARNQHELCAYCEIDIRQPPRQLEHVVPRSDAALGERKALDVANMVACCLGGTVRPPGPEHAGEDRYRAPVGRNMSCGQAKGNENDGAFIDPRALAESPSVMTVGRDGRIEADEAACQAARVVAEPVTRTIKILRLNAPQSPGAPALRSSPYAVLAESGSHRSATIGNRKPAGMTPTMVTGPSLTVIERSRMDRSPLKRLRHTASPSSATTGAPRRSSSGGNSRPRTGRSPRTPT